MTDYQKEAEELKNDREHGASYLAEQALNILQQAALAINAPDSKEFLTEITSLAWKLASLRPTMIPISNYARQFIDGLHSDAIKNSNLSDLRCHAASLAEQISHDARQNRMAVIQNAARVIETGDVIATCSYSTTVIDSLARACARQVGFQVVAASSTEPCTGTSYGSLIYTALHKQGIPCLVIEDRLLETGGFTANKVLVGADCLTLHGTLYNGSPTLLLARAAWLKSIPFYCLCESGKLYDGNAPAAIEPGFDQVPASLITSIITEKGVCSPKQLIKFFEA